MKTKPDRERNRKRVRIDELLEWAISYYRFSDKKQAKGSSRERQLKEFDSFCTRHGLKSWHESFADDGLSGYHGRHKDKGDLGRLLAILKEKPDFARGKVLVVEAWDRLGRLRPDKMIALISDLLRTGMRIGVCRLDDIFSEEDFGTHKFTTLSVFVQLAYQESKQKSDRIKGSWEKRFGQARDGDPIVLTAWLPAWCCIRDGKIKLIPERKKAVQRIFELARQGHGAKEIAKKLRREKVPTFGPSGEWQTEYVRRILRDRRAVGELQPRTGKDRQPNGEVLSGYYPAVVSVDEFLDARAATNGRRRMKQGRIGDNGCANLFGGLLYNGRDGGSYRTSIRTDSGKPERILIAGSFADGKSPCYSFPLTTFERGLLSELKEIDPASILPSEVSAVDTVTVLEAELKTVRSRLAEYDAELDEDTRNLKVIASKIAELEAREQQLLDEIDAAREEAVKPITDSWKDVKTLADLLDSVADDPDKLADTRLRLRAAIRRVVDSIWVIVVPSGRDRLCEVQMRFRGGKDNQDGPVGTRSFFLIHRYGRGNKHSKTPAKMYVRSLRLGVPGEQKHLLDRGDMRLPAVADFIIRDLENYPIEDIALVINKYGTPLE